jgi:hypothetical protein
MTDAARKPKKSKSAKPTPAEPRPCLCGCGAIAPNHRVNSWMDERCPDMSVSDD